MNNETAIRIMEEIVQILEDYIDNESIRELIEIEIDEVIWGEVENEESNRKPL